jgi:2-C-methyl-D-erythritol 4-phosphate cytidylyltransferase
MAARNVAPRFLLLIYMKASVIIAAAGEGRRMGRRIPKAFLPLAGRPLLLHSVETFASLSFVAEIVLVLPEPWIARALRLFGPKLARLKVTKIVPGGLRRQDSVENGLRVTTSPIVLVHDAARPLVSREVARRAMAGARRHGAVVIALPARDTTKVVGAGGIVRSTPDRATLWVAQTPQAFRREVLLEAYRRSGARDATDEAQLVERSGGRVRVVEGDAANFKVTTSEDLARAEWMLGRSRANSKKKH